MFIFLRKSWPLFLLFAASVSAEPFTAFGDGEKLVYRVGWGIIGGAGEITISAHAEKSKEGRPVMRIVLVTTSTGIVRTFYRYESTAEALIDRETSRLLWTKETGVNRGKPIESRTDFDYEANIARHRDTHRPGRNRDIPLKADEPPMDLVSALIQTRHWGMKPGEKRDILVFGGRDLFPVTVHAENFDEVKTPLGTFKTLSLTPRMEKEPPRGIFTRGDMRVWIAQKTPFLPVRMQLQLSLGTATLTLTGYTPPTEKPAPAAAPAPKE